MMKFSRKARIEIRMMMVWQTGNIMFRSVNDDAHDSISRRTLYSFVDDTIKLTEFKKRPIPNTHTHKHTRKEQILTVIHIHIFCEGHIWNRSVFSPFFLFRKKFARQKSPLLCKRRFGNSSNNSSELEDQNNEKKQHKEKDDDDKGDDDEKGV